MSDPIAISKSLGVRTPKEVSDDGSDNVEVDWLLDVVNALNVRCIYLEGEIDDLRFKLNV